MIDYQTYCSIKDMQERKLKPAQIAREQHLDLRTVNKWIHKEGYCERKSVQRSGKLDPYKADILRWLESHPYTAVQIYQRLRSCGYEGGRTILNDYIARVRPRRHKAFLTLAFGAGECAQVDWGEYGSVAVGSTRRRLSFFVMVLCYSRMMYVEFALSQGMEQFLACHRNAFEFFGAVPARIMVDNLKSAVIARPCAGVPVLNPRYVDLANHYGFSIKPCAVGKGNEKGRVENGVGYVKKNFLGGLDIPGLEAVNVAARGWLDTVANVRIHAAAKRKPVELFIDEKPAMRSLASVPYDTGITRSARATNRFRVIHDTNRYSVPAEYAGQMLTLKIYSERICIYHDNKLIARHTRSYDRHQDFENPDHPRALLAQRRSAREQHLLMRFLSLSPQAEAYYQQLGQRRMNPRHHIRQIVALSEIHGRENIARAIADAFEFGAFSSEYIANILEQRARLMPEPGALHLTRREDLLDIEMPEPDLAIYETNK
jgi:transposase